MNLLERAIGFVSPSRAVARAAARNRLARVTQTKALYEAASMSRRTQGWRAVGTDANAETRAAGGRLREVSRDLVRNNAFAARAKATIAHNVVGAGIIPQVRAARPARKKQIEALILRHFDTTDIDADGRLNLYGIQSLAMATLVEAGEVLIRKRIRRTEDGYALPFQLQVLEPDFLDTSIDGPQSNGNFAVQGVEFNGIGRRVAYYLFDQHPGATTVGARFSTRGRRVSADFVAHIYRVDRPGQVRGVSWFAPVMVRMRDYADYCDAQLLRQKIAACFAAFITNSDEGFTGDDAAPGSAYPVETFEPGMIERLKAGQDIKFTEPPTTEGFGPYSTVTLREIAAGLNITYEAFTGDLTNVNYSSGRMGWLEYQRSIEGWRWNMLIPQMMDPIARWTSEAATVATGSTEPFSFGWTPPHREMIDPSTELQAAKEAIRSGLSWPSEEIRKLGYDPEEVFQGLSADTKRFDDLGLVLDIDPRRTTAQGVSQKQTTAAPQSPA